MSSTVRSSVSLSVSHWHRRSSAFCVCVFLPFFQLERQITDAVFVLWFPSWSDPVCPPLKRLAWWNSSSSSSSSFRKQQKSSFPSRPGSCGEAGVYTDGLMHKYSFHAPPELLKYHLEVLLALVTRTQLLRNFEQSKKWTSILNAALTNKYIGVFTLSGYFHCYIVTLRSDLVVSGVTIQTTIRTRFVPLEMINKKKSKLSSVLALNVGQLNPYLLPIITSIINHRPLEDSEDSSSTVLKRARTPPPLH